MGDTHPHGLFSWTDIALPDPQAGSAFYATLFGWDAEDQFDPHGNYIYTMFSRDGKSVAGLGPQSPEGAGGGMPPMWMSYVNVDNVDATVSSVTLHGGSVQVPVMEVMNSGRMAIVADPQGAVFALWEDGDHSGGEVFNSHGAMTWNELATRNTAGAKAFYAAALGWDFEKFPGDNEYWLIMVQGKARGTLHQDDDYNGGIMPMGDNWPEEVPPHWMVYFSVDDTDATVARLGELGGSVSVPPFETPAGRIAVVADPQGGTFSVIQPAPPVPA